jgi:poly(3-hydroxybutyrate) depolymerase
MLSSDFPSASIANISSTPAATRSNTAASAYPALTRQADPDPMSQPNRGGEVLPPMAVPSA